MYFIIFLVLFALSEASIIKDSKIKCLSIGNNVYQKETLRNGVESPYQLVIDYDTNTLFYSYTARSDQDFKIEYLSLKTGKTGTVNGISNGFATAVNLKHHQIYMGGDNGIYQYSYDTKTASKLVLKTDLKIWQMFYKDGLYFTSYPDEKAYTYKNGMIVKVPELQDTRVLMLAVTNDGNYVYVNSTGLFTYDKSKKSIIYLGDYVLNGFSTDIDGNIFFSTPTGIYQITDKTYEIENIVTLDNIHGAAIEANGNIIYATEESIVRLTPSKKYCSDQQNVEIVP